MKKDNLIGKLFIFVCGEQWLHSICHIRDSGLNAGKSAGKRDLIDFV